MSVSGALARPMLAGMFVYGGFDALRDPEGKAKAAGEVAPMIAEALHLPTTDAVTLVRANGAIQVVAGSMLAIGKARRISALVLIASLAPTTYAGHRFWEEVDEERRHQQRVQFLKNLAMMGGLILAASDTGGRPSLPWQARRTAKKALEAAVTAGSSTTSQSAEWAKQAAHLAQEAASSELVSDIGRRAERAAKKAKSAADAANIKAAVLAAQQSEIAKQATEAAQKAAKKVKKSDFARKALKSAQKAAKQAEKKAKKADLSGRAARAAKQAARQAAKKAKSIDLTPYASSAAQLARDVVNDGTVAHVRESATSAAHDLAEWAAHASPLAS